MKSLLAAFLILLLLHMIAAVGFVGWLQASDRLDGERVAQAVDLFRPTLTQQAQTRADAEQAEADAAAARDQLLRLEKVANGPQTLEDRLLQNFEADELDLHRLERLQAETDAIRRRLDQDKKLISDQLAELEAQREEFDAIVAQRTAEMQDEDFRRAVKTLEQLPAKQAKEMVQQYMAAGDIDTVVDYLAAMQLRKSASVLKAFKNPEEIPQATQLLEQLRVRGKDPFAPASPTSQ